MNILAKKSMVKVRQRQELTKILFFGQGLTDSSGEFRLKLSLKCAYFLSKAEAHLHNKQKRQGKQLLFRLSEVCFSGSHCKNSVTPTHPKGNPNTGDPFNIQKGSLL